METVETIYLDEVRIPDPKTETNQDDCNGLETSGQSPTVSTRNLSSMSLRCKYIAASILIIAGVGAVIVLVHLETFGIVGGPSSYDNFLNDNDLDNHPFDSWQYYQPADDETTTSMEPDVMRCGKDCQEEKEAEAASDILRTIKPEVDPCDSGNWGKMNPQPLGSSLLTWNPFARQDEKEKDVLHEILMHLKVDNDAGISAGKKLYQYCLGYDMDSLTAIEKTGNSTASSPASIDMNIIQNLLPYEDSLKLNFTELEAKVTDGFKPLEINSTSDPDSKRSTRRMCLHALEIVKGKRFVKRLYLKGITPSIIPSNIREVSMMMDNIQSALINLTSASSIPWATGDSWGDEVLKIQHSLRKVKSCIGYFKALLHQNQIPVVLNDLRYGRISRGRINATEEAIDEMEENYTPTCFWDGSPYEPQALYNPLGRSVEVTSSFIQSPFFDTHRPMAMTYGAIGVIIGHEVGHAVNIRKYESKKGELADSLSYLVHQYGQFTEVMPETAILNNVTIPRGPISLNGSATLVENFSDNIGLQGAFAAFKALSNYPKISLPGLEEFTEEQLFFLGYAQTWCADTRPEVIGYHLTEDSHSPEKFRVLGSLRNSKQFASAWNCPLGSPMNPVDKCLLFS